MDGDGAEAQGQLGRRAQSQDAEGDARVLAKWRTGGGVLANGGERSPCLHSRWGLHLPPPTPTPGACSFTCLASLSARLCQRLM